MILLIILFYVFFKKTEMFIKQNRYILISKVLIIVFIVFVLNLKHAYIYTI